MSTKLEILDAALEVLRANNFLTLDAVAQEVGLTKAGIVHHFSTKEKLTTAVLDHVLDHWEAELKARTGSSAGPVDMLRAYLEHTLLGEMDSADLALLADPKLRDRLSRQWSERTYAWFGDSAETNLVAIRMLADGAWINRSLGTLALDTEQRTHVLTLALTLLEKDSTK